MPLSGLLCFLFPWCRVFLRLFPQVSYLSCYRTLIRLYFREAFLDYANIAPLHLPTPLPPAYMTTRLHIRSVLELGHLVKKLSSYTGLFLIYLVATCLVSQLIIFKEYTWVTYIFIS